VNRLLALIARHPVAVLALAAALCAWSAAQLYDFSARSWKLGFDPSANRLLPEDDPDIRFYEHARAIFGNDESLLVVLRHPDLFTPDGLELLKRLTERLAQVEGVRTTSSLANALDIRAADGAVKIEPIFDAVPQDPEALARVREAALSNPIFAGNLVSADGTAAAIQLQLRPGLSDAEYARRGTSREIERIAREVAGSHDVWVSGAPHIKVAQVETQMRELRHFMPAIFAVLAVVLAAAFRTARGVVLPLLTVGIALLWTMGVAAWLGRPLNLVTVLVPPLMTIVGLSYGVYVVSGYYDELARRPDTPPHALLVAALREVSLPVALAALTTLVGFLSMLSSPMRAVREFALLSLVGVGASLVASLTFAPAALALLRRPRRLAAGTRPGSLFARLAERIARFDLERRHVVFGAWAALAVVSLALATQLRVASDSIRAFRPDVPVRRDFEAINAALGGANRFDIVVDGASADAFHEPANLRALESLQAWLEEQPEIGATTSVVEFVKLLNRGFGTDAGAGLVIPDDRQLVGQLLFFGASDQLEGYIDGARQLAKIDVRTSVVDSGELGELLARIEARLAELPRPLSARVTGNRIVIQSLVDDIVTSQIWSLGSALAVIWAILSLQFLSVRVGLLALIPNAVPLVVFFGALGLTGIPLNLGTSLIAPMVLGISIDDTIHYMSHFRDHAKRLADEKQATVHVLRSTGRPMTYTALSLCLGFVVLTASDLATSAQLGAMAALTLAVAWTGDFTLTPALCGGLRLVTMWDTLRLDLGPDPQDSIPLFRGLSSFQCRLAALIATIREVPAGQTLLKAGEPGREMFLVLDGALEIAVRRPDGRRQVINVCRRGDVIGEVGFFHQRRSADVDVVQDARLLRLTQKNMEALTGRYPRIAAKVLRNLGAIMAQRLSNTTDQLAAS
jgi:predicted RND superfamily exporter protein